MKADAGSFQYEILQGTIWHRGEGSLGTYGRESTCESVHINYDAYFARSIHKKIQEGLLITVETKGYTDNLFEDEVILKANLQGTD